GVFATKMSSVGTWFKVGVGLPGGHVGDMVYNATDNVLLVGTLGRGAWLLSNASQNITPGGGTTGGGTTGGGGGGGGGGNGNDNNETSATATALGGIYLGGTIALDGQFIANHQGTGLPDYDWFWVMSGNTGRFVVKQTVTGGQPLEMHLFIMVGN